MPDVVTLAPEQLQRRRIVVRGVVQGVGFRPFVARVAAELGLTGHCGNDATSVFIEAEGPPVALDELIRRIRTGAPPMALVEGVDDQRLPPTGDTAFTIAPSRSDDGARTLVSPDVGHVRRLPRRAGRPRRPPVPAPVHHLHQLRPPVHDHPRSALRPAGHDDGGVRDVRGSAGRSTPTPATAATTRSRSPATTAARGCGSRSADRARPGTDDEVARARAATAPRRRDPRGQGGRRVPPGLRRHRRGGRRDCCARASTDRASRSPSWPATWPPCAPSRPSRRPRRQRCSSRPGRSCCSARLTSTTLARRGRARPRRDRGDAALHPAAPPAARPGRRRGRPRRCS